MAFARENARTPTSVHGKATRRGSVSDKLGATVSGTSPAPSWSRLLEIVSDHEGQILSLREEQGELRKETMALRQALCSAGLSKLELLPRARPFQPPRRGAAAVEEAALSPCFGGFQEVEEVTLDHLRPSPSEVPSKQFTAASSISAAANVRRASSSGSSVKPHACTSHAVSVKSVSSASSSAGSTTASDSSVRRASSAGSLGKSKKPVTEKAKNPAKTPGTAPAAPATGEEAQRTAEGAVPAVPLSWSSAASSSEGGVSEQCRRRASRASALPPQAQVSQPTPSSSSSLRRRSNSLTKDAGSSTPRSSSAAGFRASSGSPARRASSSGTPPADLYELARPLLNADESKEKKALALGAMARALRAGSSSMSWRGPETPLRASVSARNAEMARLLLEARADPNQQDGKGVSVLHAASFEGLANLCKTLLEARADANAADKHGQTALFFSPSGSVCDLLLEHKADVNAVNQKSQSALHLASRAGITEVLMWLSSRVSREVVELRDVHGATAAYYARHAGVSSDFLTRYMLLGKDTQPAAASSRRRQSGSLLLSENQEPRGRSRKSIMLGSSLSRSPLPPLLEDQQGSEDEDESEVLRPAVDGDADVAESEEELGSSSTTVPVVESPVADPRRALDAHPRAAEADKLQEETLCVGSRVQNAKTSESAETSEGGAGEDVLSPHEVMLAKVTIPELNQLEAFSETADADNFEISPAADTTSVRAETGNILGQGSAEEIPALREGQVEASQDVPVHDSSSDENGRKEIPALREGQVGASQDVPVHDSCSDENGRKEIPALREGQVEASQDVPVHDSCSDENGRKEKPAPREGQVEASQDVPVQDSSSDETDRKELVIVEADAELRETERVEALRAARTQRLHETETQCRTSTEANAAATEASRIEESCGVGTSAAAECEEREQPAAVARVTQEAAETNPEWKALEETEAAKEACPIESATRGEAKKGKAEAENNATQDAAWEADEETTMAKGRERDKPEACEVESGEKTAANAETANALQDATENQEEENSSHLWDSRDESLHASRLAADKMVTWEEDFGEGEDSTDSCKFQFSFAPSDVEKQAGLNLDSLGADVETLAPEFPVSSPDSPEFPTEVRGRLARRDRRVSLSQGLR